ncbi:MAG: lytic transglycosylase domain-containing protein [Holosporales bacterium]|jgi:soluble lytic murein transglycosylase|nr:lytic transglycosylase domain-containing protein [Holosporales bacterium]
MLYVLGSRKATNHFVSLLLLICIFTWLCPVNGEDSEKYNQWKIAVNNPKNSKKVFSFFYNNPHWPLFNESVKIAEEHIDADVPDSMIIKWFKRYPPKTSHGLSCNVERLLKNEPDFAENYVKQTWIFQNLSPEFLKKFRRKFEKYITSVDDAKKAKYLINSLKIEELKALKEVVPAIISNYIDKFLKKHSSSKASGYSKKDLADIEKRYNIIQNLIDKKKSAKAANILTLLNTDEETHATAFFNQRRHVAFDVLRDGKPKLAYDVMKMYVTNSLGKDERIAKAEWFLGYVAARFLNKSREATTHFKKAYDNSKNSIRLSKNAFWLAETYRAQGDFLFALEWYRKAERHFSTFYGYLAGERLKKFADAKLPMVDGIYSFDETTPPAEAEMVFFNRELVRVLLSMKDRSMSKHFYRQLLSEIDDPYEEILLMDLASANDEVDLLISENSLRQHYFTNKKVYKVLENKDMEYVLNINKDPCFVSLVHSVIHRESNFNENAKSHVGAVGLMQIMPSTALYEEKKLKFYTKLSLFDKQKNITIGASILNRLLKKYKNNIVYVIAAYNCGEGGLAKYLKSIKKLKNLTQIDLMELIPFKETRIYAKHVIRAMFTYQKKFFVNGCYNCDIIVSSK